jgi:hypothetical protein
MYKVCTTGRKCESKKFPIRPEHLTFNEDKFCILYNTKNNTFYCQHISCKTEEQFNKYTFKIIYDTQQSHEHLIEISMIKINDANLGNKAIGHVDIKYTNGSNFYTMLCPQQYR